MATTAVPMKVVGTTTGSTLAIPLAGLGNVSIANAFRNLGSWFQSIGSGSRSFHGVVYSSGVQASGTVTFSSIAASDTVTIGATVFTGADSPSGTAQFQTNGTPSAAADKVAAASLAAVINANAVTKLQVIATNVAGTAVVTITSIEQGTIGNFYPIAISAHGSVSGGGLLASGTDGTAVTMVKGF